MLDESFLAVQSSPDTLVKKVVTPHGAVGTDAAGDIIVLGTGPEWLRLDSAGNELGRAAPDAGTAPGAFGVGASGAFAIARTSDAGARIGASFVARFDMGLALTKAQRWSEISASLAPATLSDVAVAPDATALVVSSFGSMAGFGP